MGKSSKLFKTLLAGVRVFKSPSKERPTKDKSPNKKDEQWKKGNKDKCMWSLGKSSSRNRDTAPVPAPEGLLEPKITHLEQQPCKDAQLATPPLDSAPLGGGKVANVTPDGCSDVVSQQCFTDFVKGSKREQMAAAKIQAAFRCYLAQRAFRALKALVRLQALARGRMVRRQAATTLRCMQALVRVQARARGRRVRMSELGQLVQKHLHQTSQQRKKSTEGWVSSMATVQELQAKAQSKQEAVMKRQRALVYAFSEQLRRCAPKQSSLMIDCHPDKNDWGWIWLERWMAARPWENSPIAAKEQTSIIAGASKIDEKVKIKPEADKYRGAVKKETSSTSDFSSEARISPSKPGVKKIPSPPPPPPPPLPSFSKSSTPRATRPTVTSAASPAVPAKKVVSPVMFPMVPGEKMASSVTSVMEKEISSVSSPMAPGEKAVLSVTSPMASMEKVASSVTSPMEPMEKVASSVMPPIAPVEKVVSSVMPPIAPLEKVASSVTSPMAPMEKVVSSVTSPMAPREKVVPPVSLPMVSEEINPTVTCSTPLMTASLPGISTTRDTVQSLLDSPVRLSVSKPDSTSSISPVPSCSPQEVMSPYTHSSTEQKSSERQQTTPPPLFIPDCAFEELSNGAHTPGNDTPVMNANTNVIMNEAVTPINEDENGMDGEPQLVDNMNDITQPDIDSETSGRCNSSVTPASPKIPEASTRRNSSPGMKVEQAECVSPSVPNYMATTQSSKAKARSTSSPKPEALSSSSKRRHSLSGSEGKSSPVLTHRHISHVRAGSKGHLASVKDGSNESSPRANGDSRRHGK